MTRGQEIDDALERLQNVARVADHKAWPTISVKTDDLIAALRELDRSGIIFLDLD